MAKADTKNTAKPSSKKEQYERFCETAHELRVDDEESAEKFERSFSKIVPPKRKKDSS